MFLEIQGQTERQVDQTKEEEGKVTHLLEVPVKVLNQKVVMRQRLNRRHALI